MRENASNGYDVIIVGGGPAGLCAAMYAGRGMLKALTIERGAPGGELLNTDLIEDYIGVVGGGDAAVEEADYLTRCAGRVYTRHRRDQLRASKILQQRAFANPKIEMVWNKRVVEIKGTGQGVDHLLLADAITGDHVRLRVGGVFIFIGFKPNTGVVEGHVKHDAAGYLITDEKMMTSIPGLFAAGDVRSQVTRQITTAVGDATTAAIAVEKYLKALREGDGKGTK